MRSRPNLLAKRSRLVRREEVGLLQRPHGGDGQLSAAVTHAGQPTVFVRLRVLAMVRNDLEHQVEVISAQGHHGTGMGDHGARLEARLGLRWCGGVVHAGLPTPGYWERTILGVEDAAAPAIFPHHCFSFDESARTTGTQKARA